MFFHDSLIVLQIFLSLQTTNCVAWKTYTINGIRRLSSVSLGPFMKTLKKKLAQCIYSMSDLTSSLIHHWDMSVPRDYSGQCHGSRACPWHALAFVVCSSPLLPCRMIGVLGAVPEVALLSLLKLEWAPATKPQVHSFMLFISHTHTHTHTHTDTNAMRWVLIFFPLYGLNPWRLSSYSKVKWMGRGRTYCGLPSCRSFFLLLTTLCWDSLHSTRPLPPLFL